MGIVCISTGLVLLFFPKKKENYDTNSIGEWMLCASAFLFFLASSFESIALKPVVLVALRAGRSCVHPKFSSGAAKCARRRQRLDVQSTHPSSILGLNRSHIVNDISAPQNSN